MHSVSGGAGGQSGTGPRWTRWLGLLLPLALVGTAGCGGSERDAMRKRVSSLQDEVNLLQNTVDRLEERLAAVEMQERARPARPAAEESASTGTIERPRLKVIRLEPGAEPVSEEPSPRSDAAPPPKDPPDDPRPVIRGSGDRLETELPEGPTSRLERPSDRSRAVSPAMSHTLSVGQTGPRQWALRTRGTRA